jgi:hypothetical protein
VSQPGDAENGESIRLVLDASAIYAFGLHETVGEIIGELDGEEEGFAITTGALAEALALGADPALIEILLTNTNCVITTSTIDWATLGRFMELTRPGPTALHDVADSDLTMLAVRINAFILTDRPDRYTKILNSVITIQVEKPWSG